MSQILSANNVTAREQEDDDFLDVPGKTTAALADLVEGLKCWRLWTYLGWYDVKQRYDRSKLGPLWVTISMGAMVGSLSLLYSSILNQEFSTFLPYLSLGFILWALISSFIVDGCMTFVASAGIIKQICLPISMHVFRLVWKNLILFGHNFIIYLILLVVASINLNWNILLFFPALLLIVLNGCWICALLGIIGTRFRDIPPIVGSVMQIAFFVTPIIWTVDNLPKGKLVFVDVNPFFHLIDLIRGPLLGHAPDLLSWLVSLGMIVVGTATTFLFFRHYRGRIAFWL